MALVALFTLLVFAFILISRRIEKTVITAPMIFTVGGILAFLLVPRLAALEIHEETILVLAEITLALLLFTDATHINLRKLLKETTIPLRLLGVGMPLTIIVGALTGVAIFRHLSIWEAALLAVILAPTDAGLGQVVVKNRIVPPRVREALSVEAGLNDGLSMPFFTLFIALALAVEPLGGDWFVYTAQQIGFGLLVGIALGWVGGWLLGAAGKLDWIDEPLQQLGLLSLAFASYWAAGWIGGNGFIAAFVAGLFVKRGYEDAHSHVADFSEAWGQLLNFFVFFLFGLIVTPHLRMLDPLMLLYAVFSLTFVRMLPVAVAMIGARLKPASVLFLGWFGPRGLASIVLGLIFIERHTELTYESGIVLTVMATVLLSVFAHGLSALPGMKWYARQIADLPQDAPELQDTAPAQ